jgi:hypothetical protein
MTHEASKVSRCFARDHVMVRSPCCPTDRVGTPQAGRSSVASVPQLPHGFPEVLDRSFEGVVALARFEVGDNKENGENKNDPETREGSEPADLVRPPGGPPENGSSGEGKGEGK